MLTVAALAAAPASVSPLDAWRDAFAFAPVLLAFAGVGAFVASHRPGNPIGWLFLAEGLGFALGVAADATPVYAAQSRRPTGGRALGGLGGGHPQSRLYFPCSWRCCSSRTAGCLPAAGGWWPG